jgi:hypothetical protein
MLAALPHETRTTFTATENGTPWATVTINPLTDTARSIFPNYLGTTAVGDTRKRGQAGAMFRGADSVSVIRTVIARAMRMGA